MTPIRLLALVAAACLATGLLRGQELTFTDDGLKISAGSMGDFTLEYPQLKGDGDKEYKIVQKLTMGDRAAVTYEGGTVLNASVGAGGNVNYAFTKVPDGVKNFRFMMLIGFAYQQGGTWSIQGSAPRATGRAR